MTGIIVTNERTESMSSILAPIQFLSHGINDDDDSDSVSSLESMCSFADGDEEEDEGLRTPGSSGRRILRRPNSCSPHRGVILRRVGSARSANTNSTAELATMKSCVECGVRRNGETNLSCRLSRIQRTKGSFRRSKTSESLHTRSSDPVTGDSCSPLDVEISSVSTHSRSRASCSTRSLKRFDSNASPKITVSDTSRLRRTLDGSGRQQGSAQSERQLAMPKRNRLRDLTGSKAPRLPPRQKTNDSSENENILLAARMNKASIS